MAGVSELGFNTSKSDDLFLIGLAQGREVGVDVQQQSLRENPQSLAAGVFSPEEREQLESAPAAVQGQLFFRGWTRKEAALKALGTGFMQESRELHVGLEPAEPGQGAWTVPNEPKLAGWQLLDLPAPAGFSAALCVQGEGWKLRSFCLLD